MHLPFFYVTICFKDVALGGSVTSTQNGRQVEICLLDTEQCLHLIGEDVSARYETLIFCLADLTLSTSERCSEETGGNIVSDFRSRTFALMSSWYVTGLRLNKRLCGTARSVLV